MGDGSDPFDIENLRSQAAKAAEAALKADMGARKYGKPAKSRSEKRFTKFPGVWEETLAKARASGSTYAVAIVLLYEGWRLVSRGYGPIVKLTNVMLAGRHIGRKGKGRHF